MNDLYEKLLVELECPVCTDYMLPPIRQCEIGHSICEGCKKTLTKCPLCEGAFTDAKNFSLESLARKMHYPCINKATGCNAKLTFEEKRNHENNCNFKLFKCPIERCTWVGNLEDIVEHWSSKSVRNNIFFETNCRHLNLKSDFFHINLVQAHNQLFWYRCKFEKRTLFWSVQLIGNKGDANKYFYEVEIFKPGLSRCKIVFSDYCQEIDMEQNNLFNRDICITANAEYIKRFIGDDNVLIYYLRVYMGESGGTKRNPTKNLNKNCNRSQSVGKNKQKPIQMFTTPLKNK